LNAEFIDGSNKSNFFMFLVCMKQGPNIVILLSKIILQLDTIRLLHFE